jgi:hypothetical protein
MSHVESGKALTKEIDNNLDVSFSSFFLCGFIAFSGISQRGEFKFKALQKNILQKNVPKGFCKRNRQKNRKPIFSRFVLIRDQIYCVLGFGRRAFLGDGRSRFISLVYQGVCRACSAAL